MIHSSSKASQCEQMKLLSSVSLRPKNLHTSKLSSILPLFGGLFLRIGFTSVIDTGCEGDNCFCVRDYFRAWDGGEIVDMIVNIDNCVIIIYIY